MTAVKAYYNGSSYVMEQDVPVKPNQKFSLIHCLNYGYSVACG